MRKQTEVEEPAKTTSAVHGSRANSRWGKHDRSILVLQGGGALGAYQAGAYAALSEAGIEPAGLRVYDHKPGAPTND
jgi:predicted acylesterase/phospholipase RssA